MLELKTVKVIAVPDSVSGTVPSGATQAIISERTGAEATVISDVTRDTEFSTYAVITVPAGSELAW